MSDYLELAKFIIEGAQPPRPSTFKKGVRHGYRTARVDGPRVDVPRHALDVLERQLAGVSGRDPDNHTVYEVWWAEGGYNAFWFTDLKVLISDRRGSVTVKSY